MNSNTNWLKSQVEEDRERLQGLHEVTTIIQIQRNAGLLLHPWPGATLEYKDRNGWWGRQYYSDTESRMVWPNLGLDEFIMVLTEVKANIKACKHEQEEETGEHIAMGSFTDSPTRCQRCGRKVHHD